MNTKAVERLIDLWMNDPAFREDLRSDAEGAVKRTGVILTEDELAALRSTDWSLPDEQLKARVSKGAA